MNFIDRIGSLSTQPVMNLLATVQEKIGTAKEKVQETKTELQTKIKAKKEDLQETFSASKEKIKNVFKRENKEPTGEKKPIHQKIVNFAEDGVESVVGTVIEKIEEEKKSILGFISRFSKKTNEQEAIALKEGVQNNRREEIEQPKEKSQEREVESDKAVIKSDEESLEELKELDSDKIVIKSDEESAEEITTPRNEQEFIELDETSSRSKAEEGTLEEQERTSTDEISKKDTIVEEELQENVDTNNTYTGYPEYFFQENEYTGYPEDFFQDIKDTTEVKPSSPKAKERNKPKTPDKKKNKVGHKAHHGHAKKSNHHKSGRKN